MVDRYEWNPASLDPSTPLLLLPIRIETRLTATHTKLRVRIYPDDIHVDRLGSGLLTAEQSAGKNYWRRRWTEGDDDPASDRWQTLVKEVGPRRAAWVAAVLTPTNFGTAAAQPLFPGVTTIAIADRVRAALLPERFWVIVDTFQPKVQEGKKIPRSPALGPAPAADGSTPADPESLAAVAHALAGVTGARQDDELAWLTDYDAAVEAGMAVTVDLQADTRQVPPVWVVGVNRLRPEAATAEFCRLLHKHAHSDGFEFVATGTITNNTEQARSAWSRAPGFPDEPHFRPVPPSPPPPPPAAGPGGVGILGGQEEEGSFGVGVAEPQPPVEAPPPPPPMTPATALAHAIGAPPASLATLDEPDRPEQDWAQAFNAALWPVTWAPLLDRIMKPTLQGSAMPVWAREAMKEHAIRHVRGRGPLPTIRIAKQPYGILPVSNFATGLNISHKWEPDPKDPEDVQLSKIVPGVRALWATQSNFVPNVMAGQLERDLPRILAMLPTSRALRIRQVLTGEADKTLFIPDVLEPPRIKALREVIFKVVQWTELPFNDFRIPELVTDHTRMLRLPLAHDSDPQVCAELLDGHVVIEAASVLQALLGLSLMTAQFDVDTFQARRGALLRAVGANWGDGALAHTTRVLEDIGDPDRVDHPLTAEWAKFVAGQAERIEPWSALVLFFDIDWRSRRFDPVAFAARYPGAIPHPIDVMGTAGSGITVGKALSATMRAVMKLLEIRRAVRTIGGITDTPDRTLLMAETIDCASYRMDAWQTSRATRRLAKTREHRGPGVAVGVYGWVSGFPADETPTTTGAGDGGYVLAPSLSHSATAAVLRGAALTHDPDGLGKGPLNIDLSSTRVREALTVLDGVRAGQPLGALLGYRLERWLHEDSSGRLDRFIYTLRSIAPLVAAKDTNRTAGVADPGLESASVSDVVDGIRILELCVPSTVAAVRVRLKKPPTAYAKYLQSFPLVTDAEVDQVLIYVTRLRGVHDAIADVLLAESVHQLLRGSPTRAAAAADVLAGDGSPPPIEVTAHPSEGSAITHRVLALLPPSDGLSMFWAQTPRARTHPHLEMWGQTLLGSARDIKLGGSKSMAQSRLSAIDFIVLAGGVKSELEIWRLVARRVPGLAGRPPLAFTEAWVLAAAAFRLLSTARPATPDDLRRPSEAGVDDAQRRRVNLAGLQDRLQRARDDLADLLAHESGTDLVDDLVCHFGRSKPDDAASAAAVIAAQNQARVTAFTEAMAAYTVTPPASEAGSLSALRDMAALLFDDRTPVVPELLAQVDDPFLAALRDGPPQGLEADVVAEWLHKCATVRPDLSRYTELHVLVDTVGRPRSLTAWQLPADALRTWIGAPFEAGPPEQPVTGFVVDGRLPSSDKEPVALLVLNGWTEVIPRPSGRHELGLAVNANGPNARAPQALLLAVNPNTEPWSPEKVRNILADVLLSARQRGVALEDVPIAGRIVPATSVADWSLQGEPVLNVGALVDEGFDIGDVLSHVSEEDQP